MASDYPEAYRGQKVFGFIRAIPNFWDETHVVTGRPGEDVSVARRRGREWYLGSIIGWRANDLGIPLEFLSKGDFIAETYSDAPDADANPKHTAREETRVTAATVLRVKMASGGGQAVRIRPAK